MQNKILISFLTNRFLYDQAYLFLLKLKEFRGYRKKAVNY